MKEKLRKLNLIFRFINMDMFYAIRFYKNEIYLQGMATEDTVSKLQKYFKFEVDGIYLKANRNNVNIVLSFPA